MIILMGNVTLFMTYKNTVPMHQDSALEWFISMTNIFENG